MSETNTLNALLAPVAVDDPVGDSLRYEGTYDTIREARRSDDPDLPQGVWKTELKGADWAQVEEVCREALTKRSKDLQLAAWLMEAWLHIEGFSGVREGLELLLGLCREYWDNIHPQVEGGDATSRIAVFEWIDEKLVIPLKQIPLTSPQFPGAESCNWLDYEESRRHEQQPASERKEPAEGTTRTHFLASVSATSTPHWAAVSKHLTAGQEALQELEELLDRKCGSASPSLRGFREALQAILKMVNEVLTQREDEMMVTFPGEEELARPQEPSNRPFPRGRPIGSREEAYWMLSEAADYLLEREPHSPVPYLVKRAVHWGAMDLSELLLELSRNPGGLKEVFDLLGIPRGE